jgi:hypothetical protein
VKFTTKKEVTPFYSHSELKISAYAEKKLFKDIDAGGTAFGNSPPVARLCLADENSGGEP